MKRRKVLRQNDNRPIGIFDSGVGGLTVVKELAGILPREDIVYYGDTARVPYGTKSSNTIVRFSIENALFLLKQNVKLIVVACNTSSSVALPALKRNFKVPIVGVIHPGACDAVKACRNSRIGVIGTTATIKSDAYSRQIKRISASMKVYSRGCPLLAPAIEESLDDDRLMTDIIRYYLDPLKKMRIDTLVLGCTHYPIIKGLIAKVLGRQTNLVDSAKSTSAHVKELLTQSMLLSSSRSKGRIKFFVSDETQNFKRIGERFLNKRIDHIRKVVYGI